MAGPKLGGIFDGTISDFQTAATQAGKDIVDHAKVVMGEFIDETLPKLDTWVTAQLRKIRLGV